MANRLKPLLAGACPSLTFVTPRAAVGKVSCSNFSNFPNKLSVGAKNKSLINRRLVLGIGVSSWTQLITMAGAPNGSSFLASARQKSDIEEVNSLFLFLGISEILRFLMANCAPPM